MSSAPRRTVSWSIVFTPKLLDCEYVGCWPELAALPRWQVRMSNVTTHQSTQVFYQEPLATLTTEVARSLRLFALN